MCYTEIMKTVALKETQAPYTLDLDEATLAEGPVRVLLGEQTLGILVSPDEYEAFCAWRDRQQRRLVPPRGPGGRQPRRRGSGFDPVPWAGFLG